MKSVWFKLSQFLILPFLGSLCHRSVGSICLSFVHLFLACILVLGESDTSPCSIFRLCCLSHTSVSFLDYHRVYLLLLFTSYGIMNKYIP